LILVLFELRRTRVETAIIAAFRGGARRLGPPLNTPLIIVMIGYGFHSLSPSTDVNAVQFSAYLFRRYIETRRLLEH